MALSKYILIVFTILGAAGFAPQAFGRQDPVPGSRYTSGRGAAMGDAFLPLGDDGASGLFYNPATLGKIRSQQVEPLNISLYTNTGYASMLDLNFYNMPSLSGYLKTLEKHPGEHAGVGFAVLPTIYTRGFAFGVLLQSQLGAVANGDGTVRYRSLYQFIPAVGGALRLASGIVRLGYSAQWVHQASGDRTVPTSSDPLGYNQGLAAGSALSHTIGFALTLPVAYLPSFNLVGRNVLNAVFEDFSLMPLARNPSGVPATELASYDASLSMQMRVGGASYFNLVAEYRDMTGTSGVSRWGRFVGGVELAVKDTFFLRGGWGGGYPSAGFGLKRKTGEFSLGWISEEIGGAYHVERDTRYLLHYQVRAF